MILEFLGGGLVGIGIGAALLHWVLLPWLNRHFPLTR